MRESIDIPAAWRGPDLAASRDWIHEFSREEIAEIENALRNAKARGKTLQTLTKDDFPLPTVSRRIAFARDFLEDGVVRGGFPSRTGRHIYESTGD